LFSFFFYRTDWPNRPHAWPSAGPSSVFSGGPKIGPMDTLGQPEHAVGAKRTRQMCPIEVYGPFPPIQRITYLSAAFAVHAQAKYTPFAIRQSRSPTPRHRPGPAHESPPLHGFLQEIGSAGFDGPHGRRDLAAAGHDQSVATRPDS
jgi:hypothetical protein